MTKESYLGEIMRDIEIKQVGTLQSGKGTIGRGFIETDPTRQHELVTELALSTKHLTHPHTAGCGDGRRQVVIDGDNTNPDVLRERIVPQLFGGLGLASTKAAVSADIAMIRDCKNIQEAYSVVVRELAKLDEEDGGHKSCGASGCVKSSVELEIPEDLLNQELSLFTKLSSADARLIALNRSSQLSKLQNYWYDNWQPATHEKLIYSSFPQNFVELEEDDHDHINHGHREGGLYVIKEEDLGFATNGFIEATGRQFLAVTAPKMISLAEKLGVSDEERRRLELAFYDDTNRVGSILSDKSLPIYA